MIHRRKDGTGASILVPASNNTNGTFYSAHLSATAGNDVMLCCEHGGRAVVRMEVAEEGGKAVVVDRRTIVNTYGARMLNSPNDVIETKDGWVVFTDPMWVERGCGATLDVSVRDPGGDERQG